METVVFKVQGSAQEPYTTSFKRSGNILTARCSCPAGQVGQNCKHRINILSGVNEGIVSGNVFEVQTVLSWLKGTDVELALKQVKEAEVKLEDAKRHLNGLRKKLARALVD